jgi:AcrR family transcriptional regulator
MGVIEKRAKHKEEFRREILDSARELFINDGYEQFSMRKLADKIGYSPTTIYQYFKGKDDLLLAICEEFFGIFFAELNNLRSVSKDPIETLRMATLYFIDFAIKNPHQYKVIFLTKRDLYGTREEFNKKESMARNTQLIFNEMVQDCIKADRFRDMEEGLIPTSLAAVTNGLVMLTLHRSDYVEGNIETIARSLVDAVLRGYQK